ncbi:hypothetical protein G6F46_013305 [Rhizopus delemar]|uniref:Uncharacterized protein n=3 Tax=Rhizopus TaxID=4842 RepID=I1BJW3_RHIO9|nr:hypothetical protein RO3G_01197 [Rhizopus delemar RA 99-880]KAG1530804.1 hypothetical protein G6F51_013725 [Rhizopus arrhizus]KAG1541910.1 hypothetical protein G6F50_014170 [Rhizopus delemar]KAG1575516.1 hypothetical protein G6F47_013448 [Rhizopus delemar]KAG1606007.1 hypothetical protein G6F46_013305 [Rhizopus delemar]|eukprot:EIE76493.1 hypothetical protein RO3G_01197 [Rhizopus delemar RA 99-880]
MSTTRNTRGSKNLNAAAGPSSPDLEVTVQNLSHALEAVTARLSALEELKLELETLRGENARLAETNRSQANEIASLSAELAVHTAGVPTNTPSSNAGDWHFRPRWINHNIYSYSGARITIQK